jgi:hypothetical protein
MSVARAQAASGAFVRSRISIMTLAFREVPIDDAVRRVKGEYLEMPGLSLTRGQAQRLWGVDRETCDALLGALVDARFLQRTDGGAFVRVSPVR